MNSRFTISPALRLILIVTGCLGFASLMFLKESVSFATWFALAGIIPFLLGLLGDNLLLAIFRSNGKVSVQPESSTPSIFPPTPGGFRPNTENQFLDKAA